MLLLVLQQYLTRIPTRKCGRGQRQYLTREYTPPSLLSLESPPFDHSRSLTVHSRKKKTKTLNGWEVSGELAKRCRFWFGDNLTENMDVAVGEKQCPPFCQWSGGVCPFLSNALFLLYSWRGWRCPGLMAGYWSAFSTPQNGEPYIRYTIKRWKPTWAVQVGVGKNWVCGQMGAAVPWPMSATDKRCFLWRICLIPSSGA